LGISSHARASRTSRVALLRWERKTGAPADGGKGSGNEHRSSGRAEVEVSLEVRREKIRRHGSCAAMSGSSERWLCRRC